MYFQIKDLILLSLKYSIYFISILEKGEKEQSAPVTTIISFWVFINRKHLGSCEQERDSAVCFGGESVVSREREMRVRATSNHFLISHQPTSLRHLEHCFYIKLLSGIVRVWNVLKKSNILFNVTFRLNYVFSNKWIKRHVMYKIIQPIF